MNKIFGKAKILLVVLTVLVPGFGFPVLAQTDSSLIIKQLQEQIKQLQTQVAQLQSQIEVVKVELRFTKTLQLGMSGDDVKSLQQFLKNYPDIYPQGLVTGYFGPLTESAVKKWQAQQGIESVGIVGPKTQAKLNQLVSEGQVLPLNISPQTQTLQSNADINVPASTNIPAGYTAPLSTNPAVAPATSVVAPITTTASATTQSSTTATTSAATATSSETPSSASASASSTKVTADTTPPSAPTNFTAAYDLQPTITYGFPLRYSFTGSTDWQSPNGGYKLYRGSTEVSGMGTVLSNIAMSGWLTEQSGRLQPNTAYTYYVVAYDGAGNVSAPSNSLTITTQSDPASVPAPTPAPASGSSTTTSSFLPKQTVIQIANILEAIESLLDQVRKFLKNPVVE